MATVNIYDAKTNLSRLIARVEQGEEITISRNGRAVARLAPVREERAERVPGALAGRLRIPPDFDRFDDPDAVEWYGA